MSYSEFPVSHVKLTYKLNKLDEFTCEIPNNDYFRSMVMYGAQIDLRYQGSRKFLGIIGPTIYHDTKIVIMGKERAGRLKWLYFKKSGSFRISYDTIAANVVLGEILAATGYTIGECPTTPVSMRFENRKQLEAIEDLAKELTKDWWATGVEMDVMNIGIRGTYQGEIPGVTAGWKKEDPDAIENFVHMLGYGDGINQPIGSAQDASSRLAYGTRENVETDRRSTTTTSLGNLAAARVTDRSTPLETIDIHIDTRIAFDYGLEPGDTIYLYDPAKKLNSNYRIGQFSLGAMEKTKLELDIPVGRLTEKLRKLSTQHYEQSLYAQGGTGYNVIPFVGQMDSNKKFRFYLTEDYKQTNHVKISWKTEETFSGVELTVNDTIVSDWATDQSELEITTYCDDGWNYLSLEYNELDPTKNVTVSLSVHTFIESK